MTSRVWIMLEQKTELRECWRRGEAILSIARALERRNKSDVHQAKRKRKHRCRCSDIHLANANTGPLGS